MLYIYNCGVRLCATVCDRARCAVCSVRHLIHAVRQCAALREVVCCRACGSVRLPGSATVCGSTAVYGSAHACVRQREDMCGCAPGRVRQCARWCLAVCACDSVRLSDSSAAVFGSMRPCGSVRLSGTAAVCSSSAAVYIFSDIFKICSYKFRINQII
jgi:hypothetical protein